MPYRLKVALQSETRPPILRRGGVLSWALSCSLALVFTTAAQGETGDPLQVCYGAAARAEHAWGLPQGLLKAIGVVESGRVGPGGFSPTPWPWSINANGRSLYEPSKAAAISAVRSFWTVGMRAIDVGCFQVDLGYHPNVFPSLEAAFDPEFNAEVAARILIQLRLDGNSWDKAVALYHSALSISGGLYLQKVQAVWLRTRTYGTAEMNGNIPYVALLSPAARLVRMVTATDSPPPRSDGLPSVLWPGNPQPLQWTTLSVDTLPRIVAPPPAPRTSH